MTEQERKPKDSETLIDRLDIAVERLETIVKRLEYAADEEQTDDAQRGR